MSKSKYVYVVYSYRGIMINDVMHGIFENEKAGKECFNLVLDDFDSWINEMEIPMEIYLKHIDDFEQIENHNGNEFEEDCVWKDHLGYSAKTWQKAYTLYKTHEFEGDICVVLYKWGVEKERGTGKTIIILEERKQSVTGKSISGFSYY